MNSKKVAYGLLLAVPAWLSGCSGSSNTPVDAGPTEDAGAVLTGTVARGQYLVDSLLACSQCHTPSGSDGKPDLTKYLAGSRSYDFTTSSGEVISVYAENLTSDADQGIGTWTDDQVRGAIIRGVDDQDVALWPIMPYPEYALLSTEDVDSIIRYLRTVPASTNTVPPDTVADPNPPAAPVDDSKIPHTTLAATDPKHASAEHGRLLASTACMNCHTVEVSPGLSNLSKAFAGGRTYKSHSDPHPLTSANITPDATGIAGWSAADVIAALKTNTAKGTGRAFCTTTAGTQHVVSNLTEADLADIANFITTLAPVANGPFSCVTDGGH